MNAPREYSASFSTTRKLITVRLLLLMLLLVGFAAVPAVAVTTAASPRTPPKALNTGTLQWTTGGPYADDATAVAASPTYDSDQTVFVGVSYQINVGQPNIQGVAAILRSTNGGQSWSTVFTHSSAVGTNYVWLTQIVLSPNFGHDGIVFALWTEGLTGGVVRSLDGGASFQDVNVGSNAFSTTTKSLSISPTFPSDQTIAVTADAGTTAMSFVSTNSGTVWTPVVPTGLDACANPVTGGGFLLALGNNMLGDYLPNANALCSNNMDERYALSSNGGLSWAWGGDIQAAVGNGNNFDTQHSRMYAAPDGSAILYTDQYGNVVRSGDGGQSWTSLIGPTSMLGHDNPPDAVSGYGPVYTFQFQSPSSVYAVHQWGKVNPHFYHSADGGQTWSVVWQGGGATTLHDIAAADAHTFFFAIGNLGLIRSTDTGVNWQAVGTLLPQHAAVAVSPNFRHDQTVFTVDFPSGTVTTGGQDTPAYGIYRSANGGTSWSEPEAPNPAGGSFSTVFTTSTHGGLSLAVSPAFATDHTVFEGDNLGAIAISHDGGRSWTTSLPGTPPQEGWYVNALALSPNFATDQVVYWGGGPGGFGLFKSVDGGQSWVQVTPADRINQISAGEVHDLAVSAEPSGTLDVAIALGSLYLAQDTPASTNRQEWIDTGITAWTVAMSPSYQTDCTIYASMWGGPQGLPDTLDDGVYVSSNACARNAGSITWTRLTASLPVRDFDSIVLSPNFANDHTLFIGSYSGGVYMSTNAGQTWSAINMGLGNLRAYKLSLGATSESGGTLFVATDGGVWQTPVALIPLRFVYVPMVGR